MRTRHASSIILGLLTGLVAAPAAAQDVNRCIDWCFSSYPPAQQNGSTGFRDRCVAQCGASAAPATPHGAIAFGPRTGSWGAAYGMRGDGEAARAAMASCREHGDDCEVATTYANTCAAVAAVRSAGRYAVGQDDDLAAAKADAMAMCRTQIGGKCELWVFSCAWDKD